ncbi:MAG TPA: O-antigen ligase family protein, partial [Candidatus Dormibacteraeota bacterium]|nr:O-antigen ligase family protein [Candidatus Dormibacteraeota bacterium]
VGTVRYFFTLHGDLGAGLEVLAHEDSYFLAVFVTATIAALIWLKNRRVVILMALASVVCVIAMLANSRRAGVFAAAGAVAVVVLLAYRFEPSLRKQIAWLSVLVVIAGAAFVVSAWDKEYGIQAQLVRPIRSLVDPSARDFSSDLYRTAETANLLFTYHTSPVIGVGFGSPFYIVYPMADISNLYPLWNVIPHNSLLWIGMRMGALGFMAFWGLIGIAVLTGFDVMRSRRDPLVRAVAAVALGAIAAEIAVGYTDLQLESYRNLIFIGAILGVLYAMQRVKETE